MLIEESRDINLVNADSLSPLHVSIQSDNYLVHTKLIITGADLNIKDNEGRTPLVYTLTGRKERFALQLLINGANAHIYSGLKETPGLSDTFIYLEYYKSLELLQLISLHTSINQDALENSIKMGNTFYTSYLLLNFEFYTNYIKENNILNTAIDIENPEKRLAMIDKLLKFGANIDIGGDEPALIYAAKKGYLKVIESLIVYGPDLMIKDKEGLSVLDHSVFLLDFPAIQLVYAPIVRAHSFLDVENKKKYTEFFDTACGRLPEDNDFEMPQSTFSRRKRRITYFLSCKDQ